MRERTWLRWLRDGMGGGGRLALVRLLMVASVTLGTAGTVAAIAVAGAGRAHAASGSADWFQLAPTHSPPARRNASMAFDAASGQLLLFGGGFNDTWNWNGSDWTQLAPAHSPPARVNASMGYDAASGQLLLFGGYAGVGAFADTWSWTGSDWTQLSPAHSPAKRQGASMAFDLTSGQLLLFGGYGAIASGAGLIGDTWAYLTAAPTTTTLSSSANPSVVGLQVTYTATVSPAPDGGTVAFFQDGSTTPISGCAAVAVNTTTVQAACSVTSTSVGSHSIAASYSGDANFVGSSTALSLTQQVNMASPTLTATPESTALTLGSSPVMLTASATLTGGYNPTGTITFTLTGPDGSTVVDTEAVAVSGNGTYTPPTGYTLPITGSVTGQYQWNVSYGGDSSNNSASAPVALVIVSPASLGLTTTSSPSSVALSGSPVILRDSADLSGGYNATGTITFTLTAPGGSTLDTETVTVTGNGTYTTPTGYTLPTSGALTGVYQWSAAYSGDSNNNGASDANDAAAEQVIVGKTVTTTGLAVTSPTQPSGLPAGSAVAVAGQTMTLTATISPAPGGGTVTFKEGATTLCSNVALSGGTATCKTTYAAAGQHSITGAYSGDSNYTSSSASLTLYVDTNISQYLQHGVYNLGNLNLSGGYFVGENLSGANLSNGAFSGANFSYANLSGANLSDGNFTGASFSGANLSGANLTRANLKGATGMSSATLSSVIWIKTTCPDNTISNNDGNTCVGHL